MAAWRKLSQRLLYWLFLFLIVVRPDWSARGALNDYLERRYAEHFEGLTYVQSILETLAETRPIVDAVLQFRRLGAEAAVLVAAAYVLLGYVVLLVISFWQEARLARIDAIARGQILRDRLRWPATKPRGYAFLAVFIWLTWSAGTWAAHPDTCLDNDGRVLFACTSIWPTILFVMQFIYLVIEMIARIFNPDPSRIDRLLAVFD